MRAKLGEEAEVGEKWRGVFILVAGHVNTKFVGAGKFSNIF
jgi:hypothetical protein